jgi:hypothetical protein
MIKARKLEETFGQSRRLRKPWSVVLALLAAISSRFVLKMEESALLWLQEIA